MPNNFPGASNVCQVNVELIFFPKLMIKENCIAGMFGEFNDWQITELQVVDENKLGEWIDFGHQEIIYRLKFGKDKFSESRIIHKFAKISHS